MERDNQLKPRYEIVWNETIHHWEIESELQRMDETSDITTIA